MDWNKETIRKFRKDLRMTQKEFAKMIGVTVRYVTYLETGKRKASSVLKKLLDCLYEKYRGKGVIE
ncbi:helix-turn-helix domain-containing protein [Thermodesulfovibrio sp. TK110]